MITVKRHEEMIRELYQHYENLDPQKEILEPEMDQALQQLQNAPSPVQKTALMRVLAEKSRVHVFRHFPFWFDFSACRDRYQWGFGGGAHMRRRKGAAAFQAYADYFSEDMEQGKIHFTDNRHDHHALNYDDILNLGLNGLKEKARCCMGACTEPPKQLFYQAALEGLEILSGLSLRFAARAEEMLREESDPAVAARLARLACAAKKVPMEPAETFYEALSAILFCREAVGTLEGIGISTYGQLDRMLFPYYQKDLENGRITRQEAKDLLEACLIYTAIRFNENEDPHETSTTIILGGCDREGQIVFNEITRLVFEAAMECRTVNVKLDCRMSPRHPKEYIALACQVQLAHLPILVFMNDDTHIAARVKYGQDEKDARLYVAGGCHEIVLGGTEMCSRADTWLGLPAILMDTLKKQPYDSFEALYREAISDVRAYHDKVARQKNKLEAKWHEHSPMPLYSTMITGCLESGRDLTQCGAKYTSTALSMVAPATFIDSLSAVRLLCFDEKKYTLPRLIEILENNFKGEERLRQYIVNRLPKYGTGNEEADAFSARVLHDLSQVSGQENGYGKKYYPAFYAHDIFRNLGKGTPATPDGRPAAFPISRGASPSEIISGVTPTDILRSAARYDFTDFTDSFALEITLPPLDGESGLQILTAMVEEFLENGGSTLQFNLLDIDLLREAQKNPDAHRDIIVRVCGYSYYFVLLSKEIQDEVIHRMVRAC